MKILDNFHILISCSDLHWNSLLLFCTFEGLFWFKEVMCNQDYEETKVYIQGGIGDAKRIDGGG